MTPKASARDSGLTLPELLVTMVLLGVVGTLVLTMFISVTRSLQASDQRVEATSTTLVGAETLVRAVRAGAVVERPVGTAELEAVVPTSETSLTVHSWTARSTDPGTTDPLPVRVDFTVDATGRLVETRTAADEDSGPQYTFTGTPRTRTVLTGVVNPAVTPVFTYYDVDGDELAPGASTTGVASVEVHLLVQTDGLGRVAPTELRNRVHLPNQKASE